MTTPYIIPWLNLAIERLMKHFLTIICLMMALSVSAQSQQSNVQRFGSQQQQRQGGWGQWQNRSTQPVQQTPNRSGQFSAAEYWKQQKAFFTEKADLTEEEANAFFPLYNELQQKKRDLSREIRHIMRQGGVQSSEELSLKAIDAQAETNIKIAELEKEYLQKFKKILPASKILKVQNAEEQFNSQILKDIQQSRGHQFQQGQNWPMQPQFNWPTQKKE